jgi:hypothetical protein
MTIMFLRRRRLGMGSVRGFKHWGEELLGPGSVDWVRNDQMNRKDWNNVTTVVRWGCTSSVPTGFNHIPVINGARSIHATSDKSTFRQTFQESHPVFSINSFGANWGDPVYPCIVRPSTHSRGRDVYLCNNPDDLNKAAAICGPGWYAGEYIPKEEEYRVYVVGGRAAAVARKNVEDKKAIAWNRAHGSCEFQNVRWGDWPLEVVKAGIVAVNHLGLDFGGADIMVDGNRATVLEVNSAPSHPLHEKTNEFQMFSQGDIADRATYRQKCFVKALSYMIENGHKGIGNGNNWRDFVSPGISTEANCGS